MPSAGELVAIHSMTFCGTIGLSDDRRLESQFQDFYA